MLDVRHFVGLDLGQVSDHSALVSLRREQEVLEDYRPRALSQQELNDLLAKEAGWTGPESRVKEWKPVPARYYCNIAERFDRGIPYPTLVNNVVRLFQDSRFAGQALVIDGTGVGRPVVDLFRAANIGCRLIPVTITAGSPYQALRAPMVDEYGYWHVPKKELVGGVQVLLGTGRIEVSPGLKHAATLVHELKHFQYKIKESGHVTLEAWRERDHDDLVLALALAAWWSERGRQELWIK